MAFFLFIFKCISDNITEAGTWSNFLIIHVYFCFTLTSAPDAPGIISAILRRLMPRVRFIFLEWILRMSSRACTKGLRVVFTDQRVIIEKALFWCPATYPDSSGKIVHFYPLDYVKDFRWKTIIHIWVWSSFRKFNNESIGWLRLMKIVQQSVIWPAT